VSGPTDMCVDVGVSKHRPRVCWLAWYPRNQCVLNLETSRHAACGCRRRGLFVRLHDSECDQKDA
jgi:hypothetical protein